MSPTSTPSATQTPLPTATATAIIGATGSVSGRVFRDANRSGAAEPSEVGIAGVTVFADGDGDGSPDAGELIAITSTTGAYALPGVAPGPARICWQPATGLAHTLPRCRTVVVGPGSAMLGVDFGATPTKSWCQGGTITATVVGIDTAGSPEQSEHPMRVAGPATGTWAGSRLQDVPTVSVYVQVGENVATALLVAGVDASQHPGLTLRYAYRGDYQQALRVVAADGSVAAWLTSSVLPVPAPTAFTVVDRNGELIIYNVPRDGSGRYQDVTVVTQATRTASWLTTTATVAGAIVNGSLVSIAGTCGDTAMVAIVASTTPPTATPVSSPAATPTAAASPLPTTTPMPTLTIAPTSSPSATPTTGTLPRPDLRLSASAPDSVLPGQTLTYRLTVRNDGTATARSVAVIVDLPTGVSVQSAYGTNTFTCQPSEPGGIRCSGTTLASSTTAVLTIAGRVTASGGLLVTRATVDPDETIVEQDETNNTVQVETRIAGT